jgi:hypothetical protein
MKKLLIAIGAVALCACGGSSSAGSSSSPSPSETHIASVDPCSLVTTGEASAAAGAQLTNLTASLPQAIPGFCFYGQQDGSAGVIIYGQVYADSATADNVNAAEFSAALQGQIGAGATSAKEVSGIGDKAYEFTSKGNAGSGIAIIVVKSNVIFMIVVDPSSSPSGVDGLARTAVGRLH